MLDLEKVKRSITVKESGLNVCQYCGKEVDGRRIFCPEHATVLNKQIYEFFVDLPIRPRGAKMFDIIETYLKAQLGLTKQKRIILKSITGAGKCQKRGTLVYTPNGLKPIETLTIDDAVYGYDNVSMRIVCNDVQGTHEFQNQNTLKIITSCGYDIEGTPDHKIVVMAVGGDLQYKSLDELSVSDYILFPLLNSEGVLQKINYSYEKKPSQHHINSLIVDILTEGIAEFLGYYISEGSANDFGVHLTNGQEEIAIKIKNVVENELDLYCSIHKDERVNAYRINISSVALVDFLKSLGSGCISREKRIPPVIFSSPPSVKSAFLHAYFDGDGYRQRNGVGCLSVSEGLISDIQQLLLSMGIISSVRYKAVKYKGGIVDAWRLNIIKDSIPKFYDVVGDFYSTSKYTKEIHLEKSGNTNLVTIPNISGQINLVWKDFSKKFSLSGRRYLKVPKGTKGLYEICASRGMSHLTIAAYRRGDRKPHRYQLKKMLGVMKESSHLREYKYLMQLADSEIFFDKIEKIEKGNCDVYDITTFPTHNYIANGMISHNSYMMDMIAYIELTHFHDSETVIGSVSDSVSKEHIIRLRKWISDSLFSKYISGSRDATASKTEIHLAHLNSRIISIPQAEKTRTGWHPSLLLIDEIGRMKPDSYWGCYSDDTEVLTDSGWMKLKTVCENELFVGIATLNRETDAVEYHKPTRFFVYPYKGKMFHQHSKGIIDFLVTPEHQCYVKSTYEKSSWRFSKAEDLPKHYMIDKHFPWEGKREEYFVLPGVPWGAKKKICDPKKFLLDDWLAFFGIWIAEGSSFSMKRRTRKTIRYIVQIAQENNENRKEIKKVCEKLGYVVQDTGHELRIHNKQLCLYLKQFGHSHDKFIPNEFKNLSKSQLGILLKWLILGDGRKTSKSAYYYCTSSRQLAEDVYEIALKAGWNLSQSRFYEHNDCCYVNLTKSHFKPELNSVKDQREWVDYDGCVYDIEIPNHMFYVRRNKKCMWGSNSFYQMGKTRAVEILASTPYLDSIVMQDVWNSDGIKQVALSPNDCWWVDKSIFRQAKKDLPPNLYSQLYEAEFRTLSNRVIPDDIFLEALVRGQHLPQSQNILMGIDFGQKIDPTAIVIIDLETGDVKFTTQFSDAWKIQFAKIRQIYNEWKPIKIMADKSSIGSVIIDELSDLPIEGVSMHNDILKKRVVDRLVMAFINHKVNIVADEFPILVSQLSSFVYLDQDHKKMGPSGRGHDDFVDALGLALMAFDVSSVTENVVGDNVWMFTRVAGSTTSPWKIGGF